MSSNQAIAFLALLLLVLFGIWFQAVGPSVGIFWGRLKDDPVALFTGLLMVFTAILAFSTTFLWKSTDKLVTDTREASETQLKAYVTLDSIRQNNFYDSSGMLIAVSFAPLYVNSGQTPAKKVGYYTVLDFTFEGDDPGGGSFPILEGPESRTVIGPRSTELGPSTRQLSAQEFSGFSVQGVTIHVYGALDYTDVFSNPRRTEFSAFYKVKNPDTFSRAFMFMKSVRHNAVDEDCLRRPYAKAGDG